MSARTSARFHLILAAVLWSTSGVILKSVPSVHWIAIAGLRSLFACLLFLPGLALPRPPARVLVPVVLLYSVLVTSLMGSMQLGTAAQGIWLQYIAPTLVALWVWLVQRQRPRPSEVAAVLLTVVAVGFIVAGGSGPQHEQSLILGIISGIAFGAFILVLKALSPIPPASVHLWANAGTAAIALSAAAALHVPFPRTAPDLGLLALMGVGQLALAYHFFMRGLARTRAVEASIIVLLEPILNPVWVYLVVREVPTPRVIVGCALIGVALVAFALAPAREPAARAAPAGDETG